jgi:Ricin-type beta-trefoil lectin domain
MKYTTLFAAIFGCWVAGVAAVELNTDAMKKMQEEGNKILEEEQAFAPLVLSNGRCLQGAGAPGTPDVNVVVRECNAKARNQKWQFDAQGRLAGPEGTCVGVAGKGAPGDNAVMKACAAGKDQKWARDDKNRLANGQGLCLQVQNGNIIAATCNDKNNQRWRN